MQKGKAGNLKAGIKRRGGIPQLKDEKGVLESVIGITSETSQGLSVNNLTGEIAYAAGSIICIYNPMTNRQSHLFSKSGNLIKSIAFSRNGKYLAAGEQCCKNPQIWVWDIQNMGEDILSPRIRSDVNALYGLKGHRFGILSLCFSPKEDILVSMGDKNDLLLNIWSLLDGTRVASKRLPSPMNSLDYSQNGEIFATAGNQHIRFWSLRAGIPDDSSLSISTVSEESQTKENPKLRLKSKKIDLGKWKDSNFVSIACTYNLTYALSQKGILCVINPSKGNISKWMNIQIERAFSISMAEGILVCGCSNGIIRCFDPTSLEHIVTLPTPPPLGALNVEAGKEPPNVKSPKFADTMCAIPDITKKRMTVLYSDKSLFLWDIHNYSKVTISRSFLAHNGSIHSIQILPSSTTDLTLYATCSTDKTIRIWKTPNLGKSVVTGGDLRPNAYSRDMLKCIYVNEDLQQFKFTASLQPDAEGDGGKGAQLDKEEGEMRCMGISSDGEYLASGDQAGNVYIYNLHSTSLLHKIPAHDHEVLCIDFVSDPKHPNFLMASGSRDRLMHIYDPNKSFELVSTLEEHTSSITALAFALDPSEGGVKLISCGGDKSMIFRNIAPDRAVTVYHREIDKNSRMYSLNINTHRMVAIAGQERKVSIWKIKTGKSFRSFAMKGEEGNPRALEHISVITDPTCGVIFASTTDKIIKVRDFTSGKCLCRFENGGITTSMALTLDKKHLITTSSEGCILTWQLPEELTKYLHKRSETSAAPSQLLDVSNPTDITIDSQSQGNFPMLKNLSEMASPRKQKERLERLGKRSQKIDEIQSQIGDPKKMIEDLMDDFRGKREGLGVSGGFGRYGCKSEVIPSTEIIDHEGEKEPEPPESNRKAWAGADAFKDKGMDKTVDLEDLSLEISKEGVEVPTPTQKPGMKNILREEMKEKRRARWGEPSPRTHDEEGERIFEKRGLLRTPPSEESKKVKEIGSNQKLKKSQSADDLFEQLKNEEKIVAPACSRIETEISADQYQEAIDFFVTDDSFEEIEDDYILRLRREEKEKEKEEEGKGVMGDNMGEPQPLSQPRPLETQSHPRSPKRKGTKIVFEEREGHNIESDIQGLQFINMMYKPIEPKPKPNVNRISHSKLYFKKRSNEMYPSPFGEVVSAVGSNIAPSKDMGDILKAATKDAEKSPKENRRGLIFGSKDLSNLKNKVPIKPTDLDFFLEDQCKNLEKLGGNKPQEDIKNRDVKARVVDPKIAKQLDSIDNLLHSKKCKISKESEDIEDKEKKKELREMKTEGAKTEGASNITEPTTVDNSFSFKTTAPFGTQQHPKTDTTPPHSTTPEKDIDKSKITPDKTTTSKLHAKINLSPKISPATGQEFPQKPKVGKTYLQKKETDEAIVLESSSDEESKASVPQKGIRVNKEGKDKGKILPTVTPVQELDSMLAALELQIQNLVTFCRNNKKMEGREQKFKIKQMTEKLLSISGRPRKHNQGAQVELDTLDVKSRDMLEKYSNLLFAQMQIKLDSLK